MAQILLYKALQYEPDFNKIFKGVYDDFKNRAASEYKFELPPLDYEDFISYVEEGLLKCIILFEDNIPTGFLVYTTAISEAIELNIIHCIGDSDINMKRKLLLEKFLEVESELLQEKVTTYPMLGNQEQFVMDIANYGFKLVGIAVMSFKFNYPNSTEIFKKYTPKQLPPDYEMVPWKGEYYNDALNIINKAFKDTVDAEFDPRFLSKTGSKDILDKTVNNIYGTFLPKYCTLMLYKGKPIGLCFINTAANTIANIPLIGLEHLHRYKGLGEAMLYNSINGLLTDSTELGLKEINVTTETDNYPAIKMYRRMGFKEDYYYPQAYRPASGK